MNQHVNQIFREILSNYARRPEMEFKDCVGRSEAEEDRLYREYLAQGSFCKHADECPYAAGCEDEWPDCLYAEEL